MGSSRKVILGALAVVRFIVDVVTVVAALGFLALLAFEFFHAPRIEGSFIMARVHHFGDPGVRWLSHWFGWSWPSEDRRNFAPLILAVVAFVVKSVLDGALSRLEFFSRRTVKGPKRVGLTAPTSATPVGLSAETEKDREVLLKRFREIEATLKGAARKRCTFLSMDVVGSTKMKVDERATAIAATFQAYEELVKKHFSACGVWKQTWTPDGVMACFLDTALAISAAQSILAGLEQFNTESNQLRSPFHVRAGLNTGEVSIFEDSALEKVADHSIDVAGHMQKFAGEDALWLSEDVLNGLASRDGFVATGSDVDGLAAYAWTPPAASA